MVKNYHPSLFKFVAIGVFLFVLMVLTLFAFSLKDYHLLKQQSEHSLSTHASVVADLISTPFSTGNLEDAKKTLTILANSPEIIDIVLYDANGNYLLDSNSNHSAGNANSTLSKTIKEALTSTNIQEFSLIAESIDWLKNSTQTVKHPLQLGFSELFLYNGQNQLDLYRPVLHKNTLLGTVHITSRFERNKTLLGNIFLLELMVTLIVLALLTTGYFYFKKIILLPVQNFKASLRKSCAERTPLPLSRDIHFEEMTAIYNELLGENEDRKRLLHFQAYVPKHAVNHDYQQQLEALTKQVLHLQEVSAQALAAQQEAEASNAIKTEFLATMSHEIRMPISSVLGMAESLWRSELNDEQHSAVEVIRQSSALLVNLINHLTDFSKIESGELSLCTDEFNCYKLLQDNFKLLEIDAKSKGLRYSLEIAADFPYLLMGDSAKLSQIIINLLTNAIKFTAQGEVRLKACIQSSRNKKIRLLCEITDTGIGINPEQLDILFNAFAKTDSVMTRVFPDTGLGLAVTKQLVQLMGGKIGVSSQPGIGSTFWFWVDLELTDTPVKSMKQQSNFRFNANLLVAEDYPANQLVVQRFLEDLGCRVHLVNNGFEAVKAVKNNSFDLIFMDCQMPFLDGYQATQEIRRIEKHMPIIALTAHALHEDEIKCRAAGMDEWVTKPFTRHDLSKILEKWLPKDLIITDQPVLKTDVKTLVKASNVLDDNHALNLKFFTQQFKLDNIDDLAFISALTKAFQENAAKTLSNLQHSIDNNDAEGVRKLAHGLKSLSSNVGSGRLTELCIAMEQTGKANNLDHVQELLDSMKQEYLCVLTELNNLCSKV